MTFHIKQAKKENVNAIILIKNSDIENKLLSNHPVAYLSLHMYVSELKHQVFQVF